MIITYKKLLGSFRIIILCQIKSNTNKNCAVRVLDVLNCYKLNSTTNNFSVNTSKTLLAPIDMKECFPCGQAHPAGFVPAGYDPSPGGAESWGKGLLKVHVAGQQC